MEGLSCPGGRGHPVRTAGGAAATDKKDADRSSDNNTTKVDVAPAAMEAAGGGEGPAVREQDRFLPIANVIRIMRRVLPAHAKIADDAKETIQECLSEYISFVTSEANERCKQEQRKIITAEDLLWAMSQLGFDDYLQPLTLYLQRYREAEGGSIHRDALLTPLKRAASDAGLFSYPTPPPQPPAYQHHQNLPFFYQPHPPAHPPPAAFFPTSGGQSGSAVTPGEEETMPGRSDEAESSQARAYQGPPKDGFQPFAPYK